MVLQLCLNIWVRNLIILTGLLSIFDMRFINFYNVLHVLYCLPFSLKESFPPFIIFEPVKFEVSQNVKISNDNVLVIHDSENRENILQFPFPQPTQPLTPLLLTTRCNHYISYVLVHLFWFCPITMNGLSMF